MANHQEYSFTQFPSIQMVRSFLQYVSMLNSFVFLVYMYSKFKYSLRDKHDISEVIDILKFTREDMENMQPKSECGFVRILEVVYFPVI